MHGEKNESRPNRKAAGYGTVSTNIVAHLAPRVDTSVDRSARKWPAA